MSHPPTERTHRRRDERHVVCIVTQLETPELPPRPAVTWDLSATGALLLTRVKLELGERVSLRLHTTDTSDVVEATGEIVRSEKLDSDRMSLWSRSVAVRFDRPVPALEPTARRLAREQAITFGREPRSGERPLS